MELRHVLTLLAVFLAFTHVQSQYQADDARRGVLKKLCGMYLNKELSAVCNGRFNAIKTHKRSVDNLQPPPIPVFPFLSRADAVSLQKKHVRRRLVRGVVNECCDKPCSYEELRLYCADDNVEDDDDE